MPGAMFWSRASRRTDTLGGMRSHRFAAALLTGAVLALTLTSCGDDAGDGAAGSATTIVSASEAKAAIADGAEVIDVRTPEEFAAGHLADAVNIDVSSPDFATQVSALPTDATYVVYCRSGNRSTAAIQAMTDLGFTDLVNGGAFDSLAAEGIPVA